MHQRFSPLANAVGAILLVATLGPAARAEDASSNNLRHGGVEPAAWTGPALAAQVVPPPPRPDVMPKPAPSNPNQPQLNLDSTTEIVTPSSTPKQSESPLLDGRTPSEELIAPVVTEGNDTDGTTGVHRGVEPYGGGHPNDWSWGCGGNPYRTGPGLCDNFKVGPRWHVEVDGLVMHRDGTDTMALLSQMRANDPIGTVDSNGASLDPALTNFSYGPGGRVSFMSQVGACSGYDVQAVYEGINDWNSSVVFPKTNFTPVPNGGANQFVIQPNPNTEPPAPFPEDFEQRSLHYRSNLNSVELNWLPYHDREWRPIFGARVIRFDDEIADSLNQEVQPPLPGPRTDQGFTDPIGPTSETDRLNLFHLDNTLMGFQIGLLHDTVQLNNRFALEGFVNGGVYYNQVKYSNVMVVSTTQTFADNTRFSDSTGASGSPLSNGRVDNSSIVNNDNRDFAEISYEAEASLTGVCRLNKCWALRAGYQVMWLNHIHTADAAYLGTGDFSRDLLFYGWHAGVECRR